MWTTGSANVTRGPCGHWARCAVQSTTEHSTRNQQSFYSSDTVQPSNNMKLRRAPGSFFVLQVRLVIVTSPAAKPSSLPTLATFRAEMAGPPSQSSVVEVVLPPVPGPPGADSPILSSAVGTRGPRKVTQTSPCHCTILLDSHYWEPLQIKHHQFESLSVVFSRDPRHGRVVQLPFYWNQCLLFSGNRLWGLSDMTGLKERGSNQSCVHGWRCTH